MCLAENKSTINFINEEKIPYVFITITIVNGKKIQEGIPKSWTDWTYEDCMNWNNKNKKDSHNAMVINVNKSKYMIIDIDANPEKHLKDFYDKFKTLSFSKGLPHLWRRKYDNDFSKNGKNEEKDVDYIYSHIYEKIDSIMYNCVGEMDFFNFESIHLNPITSAPNTSAPNTSAKILENTYYEELKFYCDNNAFIDKVQSGCHTEWISLGGMLKSILPDENSKELFILVTNNGGSDNKQKEVLNKWNDIIALNDDPLFAMNSIRKRLKKDKPTIIKLWNDLNKQKINQQILKIKEQKDHEKELDKEMKQEEREEKKRIKDEKKRIKELDKEIKQEERDEKNRIKELDKEIKQEERDEKKRIKEEEDNFKKRVKELKTLVKEKEKLEAEERKQNNIFVDSDFQAINIIFDRINKDFIYSNNVMFFKNENIWINKEKEINDILKVFILNSNIFRCNEKSLLIPYCEDIKNVKNILDGLFSKLRIEKHDDDLYRKFHLSTRKKLCFIDGVLDFVNKEFILWKDVPKDSVYTTIIINRTYKEYFNNPNRVYIDKYKNDVLANLFDNKLQDVIEFYARAITGMIGDKNFLSYCGNRDSGKGLLCEGISASIGAYYKPFDLENMLCKRENSKSSDIAKENAWLIDLEFARIAISNETADNENNNIKEGYKISNKVLKSVTGGGDAITARQLYKDPRIFTIDATLSAFGNSELKITGNDSSIHHLKTKGVKQFVTQEKYNREKIEYGDQFVSSYAIRSETLKTDILNDDYCNAFIYLLYENYKDIAITINNDDVEDDTEKSIRQLIFTNYTITKDDNDRISRSEVYKLIGKDEKKILAELTQLNCFNVNCRVEIKELQDDETYKITKVRAFKCIKIREK